MTFGEYVRKARESRGLTQQELADLCGLTRGYISSIELDSVKETSGVKLLKLAKALRIKPADIFSAQGQVKDVPGPKSLIESIRELQAFEAVKIAVPVYTSLETPNTVVEYIYMSRTKVGEGNYAGTQINIELSPDIRKGDIIIVDHDRKPKKGDIVYFYDDLHRQPALARYDDNIAQYEPMSVVVAINRSLI